VIGVTQDTGAIADRVFEHPHTSPVQAGGVSASPAFCVLGRIAAGRCPKEKRATVLGQPRAC